MKFKQWLAGRRLRKLSIKLLILDVDGVLTDGRLYYRPDGEEIKVFNVQDGLGLKRLLKAGIEVAIISGRDAPASRVRFAELGINRIYLGKVAKLEYYEKLKSELGINDNEIAYLGDDLPDLPVMQKVGFSCAVANALPEVKAAAEYVTVHRGGLGAVRELCELILAHQ